MSKIDDLLKQATPKKAFYEKKVKSRDVQPGTYKATICDMSSRLSFTTKKGHLCDMYWVKYKIDEDHPEFGGNILRDRGQFRYKESNHGGNVYYKEYLDKLSIPLVETRLKDVIRYELPPILLNDIKGRKVLIEVFQSEWSSSRGMKKEMVAKLKHEIK